MSDHVRRVTNARRSQFDTGSIRLSLLPCRANDPPNSCHGADRVKTSIHPSSDRRLSPDRSAGKSGPPPPFRRGPDMATDRIFLPACLFLLFLQIDNKIPRDPALDRAATQSRFQSHRSRAGGKIPSRRGGKSRPSVLLSSRYGCQHQRVQRLSAGVGPLGKRKCSRAVFAKIPKRGAIAGSWPRWK